MLNWKECNRYELRMQAVLTVIFKKHPQLLEFLFKKNEARLRQAPEILISKLGVYSSGEKILLRLGLDLWCGNGNVHLWDIIERLDWENYRNVLIGLRYLRPKEEYDEAANFRIDVA